MLIFAISKTAQTTVPTSQTPLALLQYLVLDVFQGNTWMSHVITKLISETMEFDPAAQNSIAKI